MSLHVFQKLIELGFAVGRNGIDKPRRKFFGIDALLVGRDYEKIFDAALRQPVAPFFQQRLPQLQLPRRELRQAEKMFDHSGLAPKEPVILSDDDFVNTAVVKEAELPVLKQADEFFAKAEMVVEVGFEAGDEFLGGGEAGCCSWGNGAGKRFSPGGREWSRLKHLSSVGSHSRLKKMAMTSTFAHMRAGFGNGSRFIGRFISRQRIKCGQFLRIGHVKKTFE